MFPENSAFQQESHVYRRASDWLATSPPSAKVAAKPPHYSRIVEEIEDALHLFETGRMKDHERALELLDDLVREIYDLIDLGDHGTSSSTTTG